jgi:acetaldehyde dehydrogenase (acetylating)
MRAVLPTMIALVALTGCGSTKGLESNTALVIASCPELPDVKLVTPADSWRLHVEDAKTYNECRCAALRNTTAACKEPKPATP